MGLIFYDKIDRDFPGGVYLPRLGDVVPVDSITSITHVERLRLPLCIGPHRLELRYAPGQTVLRGEVLAQKNDYRLFCPCDGEVRGIANAWVDGRADQFVVEITPRQPCHRGEASAYPAAPMPGDDLQQQTMAKIALSGLPGPDKRTGLAEWLRGFQETPTTMVVANAVPLEPNLTAPLAILHLHPEQVFAGLAILKRLLNAAQAVMVYPYHFPVRHEVARDWEVQCIAVSDKYPQGRAESVVGTLRKQGRLPRGKVRMAVFDIQLLQQVERLILSGELPLKRVVTISGDGVERPGHFLAPIGTPLEVPLKHAGMYADAALVVEGGSLSGRAVDRDNSVISSLSESFTVIRQYTRRPATRCIRCGWCIDDCPAGIDPARLLALIETDRFEQARRLGLMQCIDCGICSYNCPARLPLMEHFHAAKARLNRVLT